MDRYRLASCNESNGLGMNKAKLVYQRKFCDVSIGSSVDLADSKFVKLLEFNFLISLAIN